MRFVGTTQFESNRESLQNKKILALDRDIGKLLAQLTAQKKGSSRNPGKHRNKNADLIDDVRASKHI
ncbi:hypothetical protein D3C77_381270 [compost metagenome]